MNAPLRCLPDLYADANAFTRQGDVFRNRFASAFMLGDDLCEEREEVTQFIRNCFADAHGARIEHLLAREARAPTASNVGHPRFATTR